jgi:arsenite-transporting ATPase
VRVLLFTGKGGAGASTLAAATAVHAARSGVKTGLARHRRPDGPRSAPDPAEAVPGLAVQLLGERPAGEPGAALFAALGLDPVDAAELAWLPGHGALSALLGLRDLARSGRFDLLVVDAPALDATCQWLTLPDTVDVLLERMLPPQRRVSRAMAAGAAAVPDADRLDHLSLAADALRAGLADSRALLQSPAASVRLVLGPERSSLRAAARGWTALSLLGLRVDGLVANRVARSAPLLAEAAALFGGLPLARAGAERAEPEDAAALARLGEALYGRPDAAAAERLLDAPAAAAPERLERVEDGFELSLGLPLAGRQDVALARAGDQLRVDLRGDLSGCRRVLTLPSALRRCTVAGARLRDGRLTVAFRPDPALWRSP